jgi:glycosyltransferase involved in cell wall biosynthesis
LKKKIKEKRKILILFPGSHLAYSPTTIQLYDSFNPEIFDVRIIAPSPKTFTGQKVIGRNVIYFDRTKGYFGFKRYFARILFEISILLRKEGFYKRIFGSNYNYYFFTFRRIRNAVLKEKYERIITVDLDFLIIVTNLNIKTDFLSLELPEDVSILSNIKLNNISRVISQSLERYTYLFPTMSIPYFLVQNAPVYRRIGRSGERHSLIYNGTAWDIFGFFYCLDFLKENIDETLVVIGAMPDATKKQIKNKYQNLLESGRLIVDTSYYTDEQLFKKMLDFEIGFCFYNFEYDQINTFNYKTAPSGKMFRYLASGVPVVAVNIPGFAFVNIFECGVLIDEINPKTIKQAIDTIRTDYDKYSLNAEKAAKNFCFEKSIKKYLETYKV